MTNAPLPCENKRLTFYPSRATDIDTRDMNLYMSHQQNVTLIRTDTTGAMVSLRKFSSIQPRMTSIYIQHRELHHGWKEDVGTTEPLGVVCVESLN